MRNAAPSATGQRATRLIAELRRAGIGDERVLAAMEEVPRELFVPPTFAEHAYDNVALPIGHGQTVSQPLVVAMMTASLELTDRHKVFEIGTGSGYQTAILAKLARRVFTIERYRPLHREAEARLQQLRLRNITFRFGDGTKGWPEQAPFDRIIVTAAAAEVPVMLTELLAIGGILVTPVGEQSRDQRLLRIRRLEAGFETDDLGVVRFVPLVAGLPRESSAPKR
jgi:protein-L-isoaspartate(D-aspartate) O-methyltransferase